jgi:hypothetical protein
MTDGIRLKLHDGGEVTCGEAELDYQKQTGLFKENEKQEYVVYTEYRGGNANTPALPFEVKSRIMHVKLIENDKNSKAAINQIKAENDVLINYNNIYFAHADIGEYKRNLETLSNDKHICGNIELQGSDPEKSCRLTSREGDLIHASKIIIDTENSQISLKVPQGKISSLMSTQKGGIEFSCENLIWDEKQDILTLQDNVTIQYQGVGNLINPQLIKVYRHLINGKRELHQIESEGHTTLFFEDDKQNGYKLESYGSFNLNRPHLKSIIESPRIDKKVPEGQQIHFSSSMGDVYANKAIIYYEEIEKNLEPVQIVLKGNVWLLGRSVADKDDPGQFLKFAIADNLEYDVKKKEMLFKADNKKRVLFFDKPNNLQISAPSIQLKRDPETQKDSVKGIGDVRFSFIEKEFDRLKKRFDQIKE